MRTSQEDLVQAPQLAVLDALDAVADSAALALAAAYPEIDDVDGLHGEPTDAWLADILVSELRGLQTTLSRYRAALDDARRRRQRPPLTPAIPPRPAA